VLVDLETIKRSTLVRLGGAEIESEVEGIIGLVKGLMEQVSPKDEFLQNSTNFSRRCLNLMQNFYSFEVSTIAKKGALNFSKKETLFGARALCNYFEQYQKDVSSGVVKTLQDVAPFRTYHWALSKEQSAITTTWIADLLTNHMKCFRALADTPVVEGDLESVAVKKSKKLSDGSVTGHSTPAGGSNSLPSTASKSDVLALASHVSGGASSKNNVSKGGVDLSKVAKFFQSKVI
jgi:hypothetical protein